VYVLALTFFFYCALCFGIRYSREAAQWSLKRVREQIASELQLLEAEGALSSSAARPATAPDKRRDVAAQLGEQANRGFGDLRLLVSLDQFILAFLVPLVASFVLVFISLVQGSGTFHEGVVYLGTQLWSSLREAWPY